jgi:probable rRNA maturation factor
VKITIKNLQKKIPIYPKRIKKAALNTLRQEGIKKSGEITICFMNDRQIKELNLFYLGLDFATDVISFDTVNTTDRMVGDIAVSADTALRNAKVFKTTPADELCLCVIHGILHLLGYDDNTPKNMRLMQEKAQRILTCPSIRPKR